MPFWSRFDPVRLLPFGFLLPLAFLVVLALWHRQYLERRHDDLTRVATEAVETSSRQVLLLERSRRFADGFTRGAASPDSIRGAFLEGLREMEAHHWQVAHGDPTFGLDVPVPEGVLDVYFATPGGIDDPLHEVFEQGHALHGAGPGDAEALRSFRAAVDAPILTGLEEVASAYSAWIDEEFVRLSRYERNAFLTALGALLLLVPALFLSSRWVLTLMSESNLALAEGLRHQAHESRAHHAAKDSEIQRRRLREESILASLAEGVLVCDGKGRFLLASPRAEELLGRPEDAEPLLSWAESLVLLHEDETPAGGRDLPIFRALRGEKPDLQVMLHRLPDGTDRWLSMSARPLVRNERTEGAVMLIRDISARKLASDEIAAAERRLRFLVDQLPAVLWTTDSQLHLTSSLGRGLKALGLGPDEVVGMSLFELFGTRDENFLPIAAQRRACEGESLVYDFDWRGLRFESHVEPLGENGAREGAIGIALDVTEARHATEEFRVARRIQQQLFPKRHPSFPGLEISGATYPANSAAGDYYDYLPLGERSLGLVVGDVSGHGVGPAMIMAETRAYLRALTLMHGDAGTAMELLNEFLLEDIVAERFVTLVLVEIDPGARTLRYTSAGHSAAYVIAPDGSRKATLEATGVPLGLFASSRYPLSDPVSLDDGDLVIIPTDGILEAENAAEEEFGIEGMIATAHAHRHESPARIVRALHEEVRKHCGEGPQQDDITAIVVKVT